MAALFSAGRSRASNSRKALGAAPSQRGESHGKWVELMILNEVSLLTKNVSGAYGTNGMGCLGEGCVGILATFL